MNTAIAPLLDTPLIGYPYVALLDAESQSAMGDVQRRMIQEFGDLLWIPKPSALHVTFLHLFSPEAVYAKSEDILYREIAVEADETMRAITRAGAPITIGSGEVAASPQAIIVKWHDDGAMDRLRNEFTARFKLPELTRQPPNIVHTTIARFNKSVPVGPVEELARNLRINATPVINELDLVRESRIYLQQYEVLRRYILRGTGQDSSRTPRGY